MIDSEKFLAKLREHGIDPGGELAEGKVTRATCSCKPQKRGKDGNGWYLYYADEPATLTWGCWNTDCQNAEGGKLTAKSEKTLIPAEREIIKARIEAERKAREGERQRVEQATREKAARLWKSGREVSADHPYIVKKGVRAVDAKQVKNMLVIPMSTTGTGEPASLQLIFPDSIKRFLIGTGAIPGPLYHAIKGNGIPLYIVEGWGTGCSVHEATGASVVIAFSSGRLLAVAEVMKGRFPGREIVIAGDQGNGSGKAIEAARKIGGKVVFPFMPDGIEGTDFNDLHQAAGLVEVARQLATAAEPLSIPSPEPDTPSQGTTESEGLEGWPEPHDIETRTEPEPYPLDALPEAARLAVVEVLAFVKAPVPLVASAALSALSLAIQAHADVMRAEKLSGPASLFLLTIADSGERKTTCDGFFTKAIREYEAAQAEAARPEFKRHVAELAAWDSKFNGVKDKIRQLAKEGKPTGDQEAELQRLQESKPEPPRVPRLIYGDATPEALKFNLAKQWPSGAVISSEGGVVFGSHGMGKDSAMRNLATLNQLWDGADIATERRTTESFTVKGARLTMALQVQESTLRAFFKQSGELARGTGFLARFLIAWPESTQGFRPFTEAPENWPHLAAFNRRISEILNQDVPIDGDGALSPAMLPLAPEAKKAWVEFHDAIESELVNGGELYDIRDVASKTADNAARLAALFQVFNHGGGAVGPDAFESASMIAAWHLNEARRFFGGLALPPEMADAARLDTWMLEYCQREKTSIIPVTKIQQFGPSCLRLKITIDAAMKELEGLGRARLVPDGKRRTIHINPALLGGDL